jgi:glycosyltransferase involved in cell wall biosynthesis
MKVTWIGQWISSENLNSWPAASPAAIKWQKHLVNAMIAEGVSLEWLYYQPEPYWPKGRLFPSVHASRSNIPLTTSKEIHYLNAPWIRNLSFRAQFRRMLTSLSLNGSQGAIVVSYNAPSWAADVFASRNINCKVIWVCIVADDKAPTNADGYVFLSYEYYLRYTQSQNKLHLDGAIYPPAKHKLLPRLRSSSDKTIFFYSGSLSKWGGAKLLVDAARLINLTNFEIWISGAGDANSLIRYINNDRRIKFLGLLTEDELNQAYDAATVFLNPRPADLPRAENNFPSKLFDYLGWGKPIISTWTPGLSEDYRSVLHVVDNDPNAFASAMIFYIEGGKNKIKLNDTFCLDKSWTRQSKRLISFLDKVQSSVGL